MTLACPKLYNYGYNCVNPTVKGIEARSGGRSSLRDFSKQLTGASHSSNPNPLQVEVFTVPRAEQDLIASGILLEPVTAM